MRTIPAKALPQSTGLVRTTRSFGAHQNTKWCAPKLAAVRTSPQQFSEEQLGTVPAKPAVKTQLETMTLAAWETHNNPQ